MRLLIILLILVVALIVVGWQTQQEINKTTEQLRQGIPVVEQGIHQEDWERARKHATELEEVWRDMNIRWDLFVTHHEIDEVELVIQRILSFIDSKDKPGALAELTTLETRLIQIQREERFSLENIF